MALLHHPRPGRRCGMTPPGPRVLVVEDSGVMRHMIRERLAAANFEVALAGNGQQALALLREAPSRAGEPLPSPRRTARASTTKGRR